MQTLTAFALLCFAAVQINSSSASQQTTSTQPTVAAVRASDSHVEIQFEGNQVFSDDELRRQMRYLRETGLISRTEGEDGLNRHMLEEDLRRVRFFMNSRGYLQARVGELQVTDHLLITIPIVEGKLYRIGEIKIEGNRALSEQQIRTVIELNPGDIANALAIGDALFEELKRLYGVQGFIRYVAEATPTFRDDPQNPNEGIVDFVIYISEGSRFTVHTISFEGHTQVPQETLRRALLLQEGQVFNQTLFEESIRELNQLGLLEELSPDRDVEFSVDEETSDIRLTIRVREKQ